MSLVRVLFVCVENSNRSQMAEAFARMHGAGAVDASSAGSRPAAAIDPRAVESMSRRGYDLTTHAPKSVNEFAGARFDYAVSMGCGDSCPRVDAVQREDWVVPDPRGMDVEDLDAVRDQIESLVVDLLARVGTTG